MATASSSQPASSASSSAPGSTKAASTQPPAGGDDHDSGRLRRSARGASRTLLLSACSVAVLWQGGAAPAAVAVVTLLVIAAWAASWLASPRRRPTVEAAWLWFGLAAWTALLAVPLPRGIVQRLHPLAISLSDAGRVAMGAAPLDWLPVALAPGDAALQAVVYALAGVVGALTANAFHGSHSRRFLQVAASSVIVTAIAAAALRYIAADLIPTGALPAVLAPLVDPIAIVNGNHMAGFLVFAFALALGLAVHAPTTLMQTSYGAGALLTGTLALMTGSRGGMLALGIAVLGVLVSTPRPPRYMRTDRRELENQARWRAVLGGIVLLLAGAIAALPVIEVELRDTDVSSDGKVKLLLHAPELVAQAPLLGWGPGSLPVVLWKQGASEARQDFAENFVVERLLDQGLVGGCLFLLALAWIALRYHRLTPRVYAIKPFVLAPGVLLCANLVDFSTELLGGLLPLALICAFVEQTYVRSARQHEGLQHRRTAAHRKLILGTGLALLLTASVGLALVPGQLTRDTEARLAGRSASEIKALVADRFAYHPYAFYLAGRALVAEERLPEASLALDRAIALRSTSKHARLFRFASRLESGMIPGAADDLQWLLESDHETRGQALQVCERSKRAEELLVEVMQRMPKRSAELATYFIDKRPDLVEQVAVALRKRYPDKRFGIEAMRAILYIRRGVTAPARQIAAELMADPDAVLDGYYVEGMLRHQAGKTYEAFHLFKTVCDAGRNTDSCALAAESILQSQRPAQALEYIRSRWTAMRAHPPAAAQYHSWVARAQSQLERWDEALDAARMAYNLSPAHADTPYILADALEHASLFGELSELSEQLFQSRPKDPRTAVLVERVRQLSQPLSFAGRRPQPTAGVPQQPTPAAAGSAALTPTAP